MNITESITLLCEELGIPEPACRTHKRGHGSYYYPRKKLISVSLLDNQEAALLHELAHHMEHCLNDGGRSEKGRTHGRFYAKCLKAIAEIWYGDYRKYPWACEYTSLIKYGL